MSLRDLINPSAPEQFCLEKLTEILHVTFYHSQTWGGGVITEATCLQWRLGMSVAGFTHRLTQPHGAVTDLDVAVEEDVGVRATDKLEHLDPEQGLRALAVPQHAQGLLVPQQRAAAGGSKSKSRLGTWKACDPR